MADGAPKTVKEDPYSVPRGQETELQKGCKVLRYDKSSETTRDLD